MKKFCENSLVTLEERLSFLETEHDNLLDLSESATKVIHKALEKVKKKIILHDFKSEQAEVYFFKALKPRFDSKLIYYNEIYKIETRKPFGGQKILRKYFRNELQKLKRYFDDHLDLYRYYRTGSTYLDHKYFLRNKHDIKLNLSTHFFAMDRRFSTSHGYIVAKILANDLIEIYLEDQLYKLENLKIKTIEIPESNLNWTGSKTALIELIYALYADGNLNSSNADIKTIAGTFEKMFNVDLGDYYRNFMAIRIRKKGRVQYLEKLQEKLIDYMDSLDE